MLGIGIKKKKKKTKQLSRGFQRAACTTVSHLRDLKQESFDTFADTSFWEQFDEKDAWRGSRKKVRRQVGMTRRERSESYLDGSIN